MSRREMEREKYREALVPALIVSAVVHALVLGLGVYGVPMPEADDGSAEERAERWEENSIHVVSVRPRSSRAAAQRADGGAPARASGAASTAVAEPSVRDPSVAAVSTERVRAVEAVPVALRTETRERERLSATELAGMFPGGDQMPEATSRAAREVSGEPRDVGDRFRTLGGTRSAGPRGGGCTVGPGAIVDRRFPQGITIGGG